jgi:hypothetical protein
MGSNYQVPEFKGHDIAVKDKKVIEKQREEFPGFNCCATLALK